MPANKPTQYLQWNPSQSNVTQPVDTLRARGYQANEAPTASNMNWIFWLQDQWTQYFDQSLTSAVMTTTLDSSMRLMGGGTLSYALSSGSFTWSAPLFLSIPSVPDADNVVPAGNVIVPAGSVIYVQANVPFTSLGDVTTGTATVQNVAYTAGISAGQAVTGAGIAAGTTVISVSGTTVTLSQSATATSQQTALTYAGTGALTVQASPVASLIPSANTVIIGRATSAGLYIGVNSGQVILRDGEQRRLLEAGYHDVRYITAGTALTARAAVYVSAAADGRTQGSCYPADASAANGAQRAACIGFVPSSVASGAVASVMTGGILGGFTGLTAGALYYADPANIGQITSTRPSGASYAVAVGVALDASNLYVRIASASGAPALDPTLNSVIVQPVTGDANTVQLALRDSAGNSKALIDSSGNQTLAGTSSVAGAATSTVSFSAPSIVSSVNGIKTSFTPAYRALSLTANTSNNFNMSEPSNIPLWTQLGITSGSIVGMTVTYRYTNDMSTIPPLLVNLQKAGTTQVQQSFTIGRPVVATIGANEDYSEHRVFSKGTYPFVLNDKYTIAAAVNPSVATTIYMKITIWAELLS
ncbi:MAG: hypothetical protein EOO38_00120 [Cytophagaceae bacterium]|nr:MAG: hypothetical protein EOO38_00120 [Cytophagaceae bacterium]